jgi:hypothetical protein
VQEGQEQHAPDKVVLIVALHQENEGQQPVRDVVKKNEEGTEDAPRGACHVDVLLEAQELDLACIETVAHRINETVGDTHEARRISSLLSTND